MSLNIPSTFLFGSGNHRLLNLWYRQFLRIRDCGEFLTHSQGRGSFLIWENAQLVAEQCRDNQQPLTIPKLSQSSCLDQKCSCCFYSFLCSPPLGVSICPVDQGFTIMDASRCICAVCKTRALGECFPDTVIQWSLHINFSLLQEHGFLLHLKNFACLTAPSHSFILSI